MKDFMYPLMAGCLIAASVANFVGVTSRWTGAWFGLVAFLGFVGMVLTWYEK